MVIMKTTYLQSEENAAVKLERTHSWVSRHRPNPRGSRLRVESTFVPPLGAKEVDTGRVE